MNSDRQDPAPSAQITAAVVIWPGNGGTMDVVVDGKLQPFAPQISEMAGDFGRLMR
ncbi:MAG: hypothetical protein JWN03_8471 [Nocardia sp.]|nr:hypothetical protein [Nocardia sp.]